MHPSYLLLPLLPLAHATVNGRCTGSKATGVWGNNGICISTSKCKSFGGTYISGACPSDPNDIKCCRVSSASGTGCAPSGYSWCDWTSDSCPGTRLTG